MHYARWHKHGDVNVKLKNQGECTQFFEDVVLDYQGDNCLIWPYAIDAETGYGSYKSKHVHRAVCIRKHGKPDGDKRYATHRCGVRVCCNPNHLRWATPKQNNLDKIGHGTQPKGEEIWRAKLSEDDIREIRLLDKTMLRKQIAERFGIHPMTVVKIVRRERWKHVAALSNEKGKS